MNHKVIAIIFFAAVSGCVPAQPLQTYQPIVDRPNKHFSSDLAECRTLATSAQAKYTKEQNDKMAANILVGIIGGAIIGNSYGHNGGYGAAYGAAAGVAATDTDLAANGPARIIDRCLVGRGHNVLSDLGKG